jgi:hypothetical protein
MNDLWAETTLQNVVIDSFINANPTNCASATAALKNTRKNEDLTHVQSLVLQGAMITAVSESAIGKGAIKRWSAQISKLPAPLFKFVRKAIVQQLATSTNLVRWGKTHNPLCPLCLKPQTNKHVLSNCSAMISLERYKTRHDRILNIIADWIADSLKPGQTLHADLNSSQYKSVRDVFQTLRPDIAIVGPDSINTLELTVCHETNLIKSKQYKSEKYKALLDDCIDESNRFTLTNYSIEVSTLGFISNINDFCTENLTNKCLPEQVKNK